MKDAYGRLIVLNLNKALGSPITAVKLVWRRLFPFGIRPKDAEAYRIGSWSYGKLPRRPLQDIFLGISECDVTVHRAFDRDITTSVDPLEIMVLCAVVRHFSCRNALEIGTFNGNTALNLASAMGPDGRVTTVDLPEDWDGNYRIDIPGIYANVTDRGTVGIQFRQQAEMAGRITQVYGDSAGLDFSRLNTPFDLIFIDGNHHYSYVMKDTDNALRHLAPGGIIAWHDYGMIEDVSRAVDSFSDRLDISVVRGTRIAIAMKPLS